MTLHAANHIESHAAAATDRFASDVEFYLMQDPRQLPSRYLYDALGSALFEAICQLPWYPLTRAEGRLLSAHARQLFNAVHPVSTVFELGAGSGEKLAALLTGSAPHVRKPVIHLVDISRAALAHATRTLAAVDDLPVVTHEATYEAGLAEFGRARPAGRTLVLFLGSNIGNFDRPGRDAFLRTVRSALRPHDALLLGTDLVKPERELLLAYDDPLGVTAAFNLNLLVRINNELGGDVDLDAFRHEAVWNGDESRVEMHLVSQRRQRITIPRAGLDFEMADGESIWTESSYKFRPEQVTSLLQDNGFDVVTQVRDDEGGFALTLAECI